MKVALFANGLVGFNVCKYLKEQGDEISMLHVPNEGSTFDYDIIEASGLSDNRIFRGNIADSVESMNLIKSEHVDFILTVYWPWLLNPDVIGSVKNSVNFHPALLPINRGWYPHVHSILDGSPAGVTLHVIDKDADTGPIWVQKEIYIKPEETAACIYKRLQGEIFQLFRESWEDIKCGVITANPQVEGVGNYHKKNEIQNFDFIDLEKQYTGRELIDILRARSFGDRGFAYFLDGDDKIFMNLKFSRVSGEDP